MWEIFISFTTIFIFDFERSNFHGKKAIPSGIKAIIRNDD